MTLRTTQQHVSVLAPGAGKLRATQQHVSVLAPGDGKLRTTRQYLELLRKTTDGKLRATRQYIEILSKGTPQSVSTIGISHALDLERVQSLSETSTLSMTQDVAISPYRESVTSTLSLVSTTNIPTDKSYSESHTIDVDHAVSYVHIPDIYAIEHTLSLTHIADTPTKGRSVSNTIALSHSAVAERGTVFRPSVISTLDFSQTAGSSGTFNVEAITRLAVALSEYQPVYDTNGNITGYELVIVNLGLNQGVEVSAGLNTGSFIGVKDTVVWYKNPTGGTPKSAASTISWGSTVYDSLGVDSTLVITQVAVGLDSTGADYSEIDVDHAVVFSVSGTRTPTTTIGITHALSYMVVTEDFCDYDITVGHTDATGLPSEPVQPTLVATDRISFAYPAAEPTTTLYFNAPEWGNIHEVYQRRINRQTRGGKRIIFRDSTWRKHEVIKITLTAITEAETINLLSLLLSSAGSPVKYTDHETREWTVVILNPDEQIVRDKTENTISIEMETI